MTIRISRLARVALLLPGLAACAEGSDAPLEAVWDSAGITIVENTDGEGLPRWTTSAEPLVAIGTGEEGGFGLIAGVIRLNDGTIAAADALARTVRFYNEAGVEIGSAGRRGEGPGEFEAIGKIWASGTDSVAVWDPNLLRYTVLASDGGYSPPVRLQTTAERARPTPVGFLSDGRVIVESDSRQSPFLATYRAEVMIIAFDGEGAVTDTLTEVPGWKGGIGSGRWE